jgi:hypothetical protein
MYITKQKPNNRNINNKLQHKLEHLHDNDTLVRATEIIGLKLVREDALSFNSCSSSCIKNVCAQKQSLLPFAADLAEKRQKNWREK